MAMELSIYLVLIVTTAMSQAQETNPPNVFVDNVCICVTKGYCSLAGGGGPTDGSGMLDERIMTSGGDPSPITGANNATMQPTTSGIKPMVQSQESCDDGLEICCPPKGFSCGMVFPPVAQAPKVLPGQGQAPYGAFPWHAAIMTSNSSYFGSGVLIDNRHVLTTAHTLNSTGTMKIRLGEWDGFNTDEPFQTMEFNVSDIFIHPKYQRKNLQYDLAVLRLSSSVPLGVNPIITNICLPSTPIQPPIRCWISGWGKDAFNGSVSSIMRTVDVPLVDAETCQKQLRTTRLGKNFVLDRASFICAGGEAGKDACGGDGGAPLACSIGGRWFLAGLVSWGIGCGTEDLPGVYVNTFNLTKWIQETTMKVIAEKGNPVATTPSASNVPTTIRSNMTTSSGSIVNATTMAPATTISTLKPASNTTVASNASVSTTAKAASSSGETVTNATVVSSATTLKTNVSSSTVKNGAVTSATSVRLNVTAASSTVKKSDVTTKPTVKSGAKTTEASAKG